MNDANEKQRKEWIAQGAPARAPIALCLQRDERGRNVWKYTRSEQTNIRATFARARASNAKGER